MLIAISQRNIGEEKGASRGTLENDYVKYFENFGITLLLIPNVCKNIEKYFDELPVKGIILSGGDDVNPSLYGGKGQNRRVSAERDDTEKKLVEISIKKKIPLIGICRGAQLANVFFGGKLVQNIKSVTGINHVGTAHLINIIGKEPADLFEKEKFTVNSYHDHGINASSLSADLIPFALSSDGIVEGFYHPKYAIAGILWHPERQGCDKEANKKLVEAFLRRTFFWSD